MIKTVVLFFILGLTLILALPLGVVFFLGSLAGLKKPLALPIYKVAQGWAWLFIRATGCRLDARGMEHIPGKGSLCIVSNHNSIFDIVLALALIGRPFGFIAKKELAVIPVLNMWIPLLGGLFIDRKNTRRAIETINGGIRRIKEGGAMIIFPEGTRSKGRGMLPFKPGSLKLATKAAAPVVPMAIAGSYSVFEETRRIRSVPVRVIFSPSIDTVSLLPEDRKQHLSDQVYGIIAESLRED